MKKHTMVDLETLGRRAGCSILSIGATYFDETGVEGEFYAVVNQASCEKAGLHTDPETLAWWEKQSEDARKVLEESRTGGMPLIDALDLFGIFVGKTKVWGNGADFDNAILYACYAAVGKEVPWKFWDSRCYRTLKGLFPSVKLVRQGTYHNALADAISQTNHASEILRTVK